MAKNDIKNINLGIRFNGLRQKWIKQYLSPYKRYAEWFQDIQWWTRNELLEYQNDRLRELVNYAMVHVPFYRQWQETYQIDSDSIWSADDMFQLPLVEKVHVNRQPEQFVSDSYNRFLLYRCHTSGSTGTPLVLYRNIGNVGFEYAMIMRQYRWAGVSPFDRVGILKGTMVPSSNIKKGRYWVWEPFERRLYLSSYHLSLENARAYVRALLQYKPAALDGYPSSIYLLARMLESEGVVMPLRAVLTSSETLSTEQKTVIERVFKCRIFDYYGLAERVAAIHTCEHGNYHIVQEYGIVELAPASTGDGHRYEIIGTALNNRAMPLIRYRTGDMVVPSAEQKCPCGRNYPMIKSIEGRMDDYIVTPGKRLIGRLDHIFKGADHVLQAQLHQKELDYLVLRVVPDENYSDKDSDFIVEKLLQRIGEPMRIDIETVTELERGGRGKMKSVVSDIPAFHETESGVS